MSDPPSRTDGGWGWIVVLACFVVRVFVYGMTTTSGILYVIFLDEFNENKGATAMIGSLITAAGFFVGTLAGVLVNKFDCRVVVIFAGLLAATGLVLSVFATSVVHLIISYGVVTGCGFGLCYVPCSVLVSQYFDKKRNLALGLAASGGGFGSFLFPILMRWLIGIYGWRGTLLICGGLTLNMCVCGAVMRPFVEDSNNNQTMTRSQLKIAQALFHWEVLKNTRYMIFMISHVLFAFGISAVYVHLYAFGNTIGISQDQSAAVFSTMGVVVTLNKVLTGFVASHPKVDEQIIYIVMLMMAGACAAMLPLLPNLIWVGCMACVFAMGYSTLGGCVVPALCARYCGVSRLTTSYGLSLLVDGVGHFMGAPVAGWLYEFTGIYSNSFYLAGVTTAVAGAIMIPVWRCMGGSVRLLLGGLTEDSIPEKELLNQNGNKPIPATSLLSITSIL